MRKGLNKLFNCIASEDLKGHYKGHHDGLCYRPSGLQRVRRSPLLASCDSLNCSRSGGAAGTVNLMILALFEHRKFNEGLSGSAW